MPYNTCIIRIYDQSLPKEVDNPIKALEEMNIEIIKSVYSSHGAIRFVKIKQNNAILPGWCEITEMGEIPDFM